MAPRQNAIRRLSLSSSTLREENWELGDECFALYKIKPLVDQYAKFWSLRKDFRAQNILELGMWDGGSIAFWFEYFSTRRSVGWNAPALCDAT